MSATLDGVLLARVSLTEVLIIAVLVIALLGGAIVLRNRRGPEA